MHGPTSTTIDVAKKRLNTGGIEVSSDQNFRALYAVIANSDMIGKSKNLPFLRC